MRLSLSNIDLEFLHSEFQSTKFELWQSTDDEHFISCFVAQFDDVDCIEGSWRKITNHIALDFQQDLKSMFATWNIYLVLIAPVEIDKHLKYKIENDRFALRKIVLSKFEILMRTKSDMDSILGDIILGNDLVLEGSDGRKDEKSPNDNVIYSYLSSIDPIPSDAKERSSQIRKKQIVELIERTK